ncbi:MAG: hypothetical protein MK010_08240 [Erythrobacter sp.]|nr:hypothetical protein [Erythrobacter sp.]
MFPAMMMRSSVSCVLLMMLAACGSDPAPAPSDDGRQGAEGEVRGGTISDDMLPLDTLRSQSPPQSGVGEDSESGAEGGAAPATDASPADEPAASDEATEDGDNQ